MTRLPSAASRGFTVVEILVVMSIILVLAGLVLATSSYVHNKGARSRAEAEIAAISAALENYKADNGVYPQYAGSGTGAHALYQALAGDGNNDIGGNILSTGVPASSAKSYMALKPNMMKPNPPNDTTVLIDPFGDEYRYRTASAVNPTFDLWSIANANPPAGENQWIKNW